MGCDEMDQFKTKWIHFSESILIFNLPNAETYVKLVFDCRSGTGCDIMT